MDENNVNVNVENEEVKRPIYSSKFLMTKNCFMIFVLLVITEQKKYF